MSAAIDNGLGKVRTSVEISDIRLLTTDTVLVSCVETVHDQRRDAETTPPVTGALSYVVVQPANGWQLSLAQTTPIFAD